MAQRTTPKKAKPVVDEKDSPYNQVDKDAIARSLLDRRLAATVGLAIDARLGYMVQGEGEGASVSLVPPDLEAADSNEKRAAKIAAMLEKVGGHPDIDRVKAAHLAVRETAIESEHAHWATMAEFPEAFDEPSKMVSTSLSRLDQALHTIRQAQAGLPAEYRGPDAVVAVTEDELAAARATKEVEAQAKAEAEAREGEEEEMARRREAEAAEAARIKEAREAQEAEDERITKREQARHDKAAKKSTPAPTTGGEE